MVGFPDEDIRQGRQYGGYGGDRDESSTVTGIPMNYTHTLRGS